jgi:signal transduction histidine kinase
MTISATVGTSVLFVSGSIPASSFWATWAVWWTGDAMGVLLVAPFLLSLRYGPKLDTINWGRMVELVGLLAATAVVAYLLFQVPLGLQYLVVPVIVVAAWRFGLRGAAPAALIASGVAIWSAINQTGPFHGESLLQNMVTLQAFNVTVAAVSFVLAGYIQTRQRQEEMARLYAGAKAASEAKTQFLHMAAHELRTPISVVTGYLAMLADGSLGAAPERWRRPLEILGSKAKELNSIVTDLLEASRIEANALPFKSQLVDLRSVAEAAADRANPRANLMGGEIVLRLGDESTLVEADPEQLGRVLDNLLNNGLTYTVRAPRVLIEVASEADLAVVRVKDNGAGIADEERERIFERFHRSNDPAFRMAAGTGLGLFIARELARRHGGTLIVESSRLDEGSVFALTMPLASAASRAAIRVEATAGEVEELVTIS